MKTIFSKVKLRSGQIVQLFLLVLLSAVGQMLLPSFLAQMISHGVAEGENRIVWMYAVIMAGVTLFSCVISFLSVKIASYISTDFAAQLRTQVFSKVQEFSAAEMDRFGTASLVTRSTSDITNVQNFLTLLLRVGLLAPMMAAAGLVFSAATGGEVSSVLLVCDTGSSDCIDDHHGTGIEVFDRLRKNARSDQQIVFGIVGRSTCDPQRLISRRQKMHVLKRQMKIMR